MKIAHLTTVDMSLRLLVFPQLRAVVERGGESLGISAPGPWVAELEAEGVRHAPLPSSTRGVDWRADLRSMVELWRVLRRERPDVLHTHNPKPGVYGRILGRLVGVPVIVNTVHGYYATDDDPWVKRLVVYALEAVASRFSDAELFQNPEDLDRAIRLRLVPRRKAILLGNGVDLERFRPTAVDEASRRRLRDEWGVGEGQVVVGMVGRLVAEKGYLELFDAAELLPPEVVVVVVGPDDETKPDALPRSAMEKARACGIRFLGMRRDMDRLYEAFDLFVLPSHREGFPRAAMEAAASGLPVVATDIRGCRQVVEDGVNGLMVQVGDARALAEAIIRVATDAELRASMSVAARAKAERDFDERRVVDIVMASHRDACDRNGVRWTLDGGTVAAAVRPARVSDLPVVARLHAEGISTGFLSQLGRGFLVELYRAMVADEESYVFVAVDDQDRTVGFISGTASTGRLYRRFLLSFRAVRAAVRAWRALVRPATWRTALETLRYGGDSDHHGGELLAMAVDESARGGGVGQSLGERLLTAFRDGGVEEAVVVVGADNLPARRLYERLGFADPQAFEMHAGQTSVVMTWSA